MLLRKYLLTLILAISLPISAFAAEDSTLTKHDGIEITVNINTASAEELATLLKGVGKKRAQDIAKEHWLCGDCEQLFSRWEREFANKVFYPFVNEGKSVASYGNWMSKFCASLSWRTLTYIRSKNPNDENDGERKVLLDAAQEHLRKYLISEADNLNQYEQHLFPLEKIEST